MGQYYSHSGVFEILPSNRACITGAGLVCGTIRDPSDPLFYAPIEIQNAVVGSRYWVAQASDLTNVLASGVAESSDFVIDSIPAYSNPMLVQIRIRSATSTPKYIAYRTYASLVSSGVIVYVSQVEDDVA